MQIIGVVGAGTMGGGIAETAVTSGFDVILYDVADEILARAQERLQASLARQVQRKRITAEQADAALARLRLTTRLDDLDAAGLIVEAAPEDLALKRDLLARLDAIALPDTILASNTSSLSISRLAEATQHPERVVGMHFFNPAPVMPLIEVIPGQVTAPQVVAKATATARALGKTPVQARDTPGVHRQPDCAPVLPGGARAPRSRRGLGGRDRPDHASGRRIPHGPVRTARPDRPGGEPGRDPLYL